MKKATLALAFPIAVVALMMIAAPTLRGRPERTGVPTGLAADPGLHRGLASLYPGDVGIAEDSSVVFFEDFESGDLSGLVSPERWTSWNNKDNQVLSFVADSVPGSPGRRSLMMTGARGRNTGGDLWKLLDRGYDRLYARFYVKFAPDAPYVHHFVHLGGKTSTARYPEGGAGIKPSGYDRFSTSLDLGTNAAPPGAWFFYSYWAEMRSWQNPDGSGNSYYGNSFPYPADTLLQARREEWQCLEIMIKLNTPPDGRDGEQAFWIDGKLSNHWYAGSHTGTWFRDKFFRSGTFNTDPRPFEGFLWRKTDNLKINTFWLQYYLASIFENDVKPADPSIPYNSSVGKVTFDNIVLATRYIGPVAGGIDTGFDFDGDGKIGPGDVHRLLKMRVEDPGDMRADYDRDGRLSIMDALRMLLDLIRG